MGPEKYYLSIGILLGTFFILLILVYLSKRYRTISTERAFIKLLFAIVVLAGIIFFILALPISDGNKQTILSFLGILIGAIIALSSTTFVSNGMSGIMLGQIRPFKAGDFIRFEDTFGRVSDVGILHTQIQSVDRDMITVPNLKLISTPLVTISASGTIISANVSLGYDIPGSKIEGALKSAAEKVELDNIFVHVMELGDFSVTYKVGGLLKDVSVLITRRSDLKKLVMDSLHQAGIEIVSPAFMNQRVYADNKNFIPQMEAEQAESPALYEYVTTMTTEDVIFDKAIEAQILKRMEELILDLDNKGSALKAFVSKIEDEKTRNEEQERLLELFEQKDRLKEELKALKDVEGGENSNGVRLKALQYLDSEAAQLDGRIRELLDRIQSEK